MFDDTICAISTALKQGAISIVRMSGSESFDIISKISDIKDSKPNSIVYGHIYEKDRMVDEVLVSFFEKGKSYTKEAMVEINCHGGVYVTKQILSILLENGCRLALPGEFTKRAYLNGRIDLSKAESVNDLIQANTSLKARFAINGLNGSVERLLMPLMDEMKNVISMIEVNIDYPEYEDEKQMSNDVIKPYLLKWIMQCEEMIDKASRFNVVKDGVKTVIVGKPNVGKSSLLNALIEEDKAIVTDIAGTTRDLVEGRVNLENVSLNLIDTAGIRKAKDSIEEIGIEKSKQALLDAELIILVLDGSNIDEEDYQLIDNIKDKNYVIVYNKSDIKRGEGINISAKNNDIVELVNYLNEKYKDDVSLVDEDLLNNERQISLMKKCLDELVEMKNNMDNNIDILITNLDEAYHYLCEILGKEYQEELINHMFENFCLGK